MTVLMVPEDDLVVLGELYPRQAVDAERVILFAELLQENPSALPPIRAAHVDGVAGYVVSDGVHRLHAYRRLGTKDIPVDVWPANSTGTVYLDALRTATQSAQPLTRVEKQKAVARLHAEGHGQREIARLLGIPTSTVHDWLSGSGHPQSSHRRTGPSSSKAEKVAGQLARAVDALDRIDEEDEEAILLALIEALGPDRIELLAAVSEVLQEELSRV